MNAILRYISCAVLMLFFTQIPAFAQEMTTEAPDPRAMGQDLTARDFSDACIPDSRQIRVNVIGVAQQGIMKLELYNAEDGFLSKSGRLRSIRDAAQDGPQMMCVNIPEAGFYGMAGYHDKDGNRKLKKKWDFTPREPYGLSNNPEIKSRRIPKWEEVSFYVSETGADIDIILVDLKARKKDKKRKEEDKD